MEKEGLPCPVCNTGLVIRLAHGRKSGKSFVMLICPKDGRHIRAFINDKKFVGEVLGKLEHKESSHQDISHPTSSSRSKSNLEHHSSQSGGNSERRFMVKDKHR